MSKPNKFNTLEIGTKKMPYYGFVTFSVKKPKGAFNKFTVNPGLILDVKDSWDKEGWIHIRIPKNEKAFQNTPVSEINKVKP